MPSFDVRSLISTLLAGAVLSVTPALTASAATNPTTGDQQLLVLLVNFQDSALTPFTVDQARDVAFNTVAPYYRAMSGGQLRLAGTTRGWFTLPIASTCDTALISQHGDAAATAAGIDVASYGRRLYLFAGSVSCRSAGFSTVTAYPSRTFLNTSIASALMAHELGHALGLDHADLLDCGAAVMGSGCSVVQDDVFDPMGSDKALVHLSATFKDRLGWMTPATLPVVTSDGDYTLAPFEAASPGLPNALKIYKGPDPASGVPTWYYVEYRQPLGYDAPLASNANVMNGVLVRYGVAPQDVWTSASTAQYSTLLDMTPASASQEYFDRRDPALTVGRSFTDPTTGLTITTLWADGSTAGVRIKLGSGGSGPSTPPPAANSAPLARDDAASTAVDKAVTVAVLANDSDADGNALKIVSTTQGALGTVSINADGSVTYKPGRKATGSDSFTYVVSDGLATATARVSVTFTASSGGKRR